MQCILIWNNCGSDSAVLVHSESCSLSPRAVADFSAAQLVWAAVWRLTLSPKSHLNAAKSDIRKRHSDVCTHSPDPALLLFLLGSHVRLLSLWPRSAFGGSVAVFPGTAIAHLVLPLALAPNLCSFTDLSLPFEAFVEDLPVMSELFYVCLGICNPAPRWGGSMLSLL